MPGMNPQNHPVGYARVSTYGQTLGEQLDQLRVAGCARIYREKGTGARADRRELLRMLKGIGPGDVVTVTRIDRLARSPFDLFAIVKQIVDANAQFRSLAEPWADTATSAGRLMIAVLGGLADVERDLIRTRTAEGRSRAKAAKPAPDPVPYRIKSQHYGRHTNTVAIDTTKATDFLRPNRRLRSSSGGGNTSNAGVFMQCSKIWPKINRPCTWADEAFA